VRVQFSSIRSLRSDTADTRHECIIVSRVAAIFINGARDDRPVTRRNRGVTPGDFNERIGALASTLPRTVLRRVICNFNLILLHFRSFPPLARGWERKGRVIASSEVSKNRLAADLASIPHSPVKFYGPIMPIIAYNEVVKVLSAFSRCLILL
jgi:hypothetical protein